MQHISYKSRSHTGFAHFAVPAMGVEDPVVYLARSWPAQMIRSQVQTPPAITGGIRFNRQIRPLLPRLQSRIRIPNWEDRPTVAPPDYLVQDLLPLGSLTVLTGESGIGKTREVLRIAKAVAMGEHVHGRTTLQGAVAIFDYEMGESLLNRYGQELGLRGPILPNFNVPFQELESRIISMIEAGVLMFVLDSYASLANQLGIENAVNSNSVAERILKPLSDLAHKYEICIVVLHHTNKGNVQYDGSQRIKGLSDQLLYLRLDRRSEELHLQVDKSRYEIAPLRWDAKDHPKLNNRGQDDEEELARPAEQYEPWVLAQLHSGPMTAKDLEGPFEDKFAKGSKTLERVIKAAVDRGSVERLGRKLQLTDTTATLSGQLSEDELALV